MMERLAASFSSLTMEDFTSSMKKFASQTATAFTRAKQYTEEQLGKTEKTEFDARFESLAERADKTKLWAERISGQAELLLQPNPGQRLEDFVYKKMDKEKPPRLNNNELLGNYMISAGNEFGPGASYGSALVKCGVTQRKLGEAERDFMQKTMSHFLDPLKNFLEGDMKTISKERRALLAKRLDLDAAKNKLRKAQNAERMQQIARNNGNNFNQNTGNSRLNPNQMYSSRGNLLVISELDQAEAELRVAQAEFDRQYEVTKLLLDGITTTHASHLRALQSFTEAQAQYYAQCSQYMQELQRQLASPPGDLGQTVVSPPSAPSAGNPPVDIYAHHRPQAPKKAKVLYDYDASDKEELSLLADEVITVYTIPGLDNDWMVGERGNQRGKVPVTYLEMMQ